MLWVCVRMEIKEERLRRCLPGWIVLDLAFLGGLALVVTALEGTSGRLYQVRVFLTQLLPITPPLKQVMSGGGAGCERGFGSGTQRSASSAGITPEAAR